MINQEIEKKLNKQINLEFWSSQLYLSMSAYFSAKGVTRIRSLDVHSVSGRGYACVEIF